MRADRRSNPAAGRSERATVLVAVPALALIAVVLSGIALDLVGVHAAQRRARTIIATAADDGAGMLDRRRIQLDAAAVIDAAAARRVVVARLRDTPLPGRVRAVNVQTGPRFVDIRVSLLVRRPVLRALPGIADEEPVDIHVRAVVAA